MRNLLIIDKEEYKEKHSEYINMMNGQLAGENEIFYTAYEDGVIRKVRNYKYIGSALQHILYWKKSYAYAKEILKNKYDNIYCLNPIVGLFLGLKSKTSRILLAGFLFEPKRNRIYYFLRKRIVRFALKGIDKAVVYGSKEVGYYTELFPETKFVFLKYGIDFTEPVDYESKKIPEKYIFSGGGSNRDYRTLINAYNKHLSSQHKLVIATQPWRLDNLDTSRIVVLEDVVLENFGDVIRKAELLVLSLYDRNISAGHMVMFQAMGLGIPIVVNDIATIRDYVDEKSVTFFESKNQKELGEKVIEFFQNPERYKRLAANAVEVYKKEMTFASLLKRLFML